MLVNNECCDGREGGMIYLLLSSCLKEGGREGFKYFSLLLLQLHQACGGRGRLVPLGAAGLGFPDICCWLVMGKEGCEGGGGGVMLWLLFSCLDVSMLDAAVSALLWSLEGFSNLLHGTPPWHVSLLGLSSGLSLTASPPPTRWGRGCSVSW